MLSWLPWRRARRNKLRNTPLPDEMRQLLFRNVPYAARLDPDRLAKLEGLIQVFGDDKTFEGLAGLDIDDEIRITIAGQACVLLLGHEVDVPYPGLDVIRVYPASYRAASHERVGDIAVPSTSHRLGESSHRGYVVLSWRSVREGTRDPADGRNVVLHEFAHQLDQLDGVADGAPPLTAALYGPWAKVLGEAFSELEEDVAKRRHSVIRAYGATNPAEFFAVATEEFFERPNRLRQKWPDVYEVMARYYNQDPALESN